MSDAEQQDIPPTIRTAQFVVLLQSAGLAIAAIVLVIATLVSTPHRLWIPLALAALALGVAAILVGCARGIGHDRLSARTPIVLTELLCLPVGYSLGVQAGKILFGGPILITAVVVLAMLFSPSARARL